MYNYTQHQCDILIIGAGGAGLRAAIEAAQNTLSRTSSEPPLSKGEPLRIAVVCKSLLGKAHTVMAEGGVAAALGNVDSSDNWQVHFRDTIKGGKWLNNWRMVEIFTKEAPDRVKELEQWGAVFDRDAQGRINQRPFGGHSLARLAHVGDRTGLEMIRTLQDKAVHLPIDWFMEYTVVKLFTQNRTIVGALAYDRATGQFVVFQCKAIILATGGCARAFAAQTNSWEGTGDGHALGLEANALIQDMEFMQFHPTGMMWPRSLRGILVTEGVRGEGGVLRNSKGERFMFRYIPEAFKNDIADNEEEAQRWVAGDRENNRKPPELLTRDVVARAIHAEVKAGRGSPHGGVYLDITSQRNADYIRKKLPSMYQQFLRLANVDITKMPMEVGPTAHYIMGGVQVDTDTTESSIQGLLAAGEVAAGLHGANRLGGNSLSDLLVFGKRAGEHAVRYCLSYHSERTEESSEAYLRPHGLDPSASSQDDNNNIPQADIETAIQDALAPFEPKEYQENPYHLQQELKELMDYRCGIIRNENELTVGLEKLEQLKARAQNVYVENKDRTLNTAWHAALDLKSLLTVSEMMLRSARMRRESRGAHTRDDYPNEDPEWGKKNIVLKKENGEMTITHAPLPVMPEKLKELTKL